MSLQTRLDAIFANLGGSTGGDQSWRAGAAGLGRGSPALSTTTSLSGTNSSAPGVMSGGWQLREHSVVTMKPEENAQRRKMVYTVRSKDRDDNEDSDEENDKGSGEDSDEGDMKAEKKQRRKRNDFEGDEFGEEDDEEEEEREEEERKKKEARKRKRETRLESEELGEGEVEEGGERRMEEDDEEGDDGVKAHAYHRPQPVKGTGWDDASASKGAQEQEEGEGGKGGSGEEGDEGDDEEDDEFERLYNAAQAGRTAAARGVAASSIGGGEGGAAGGVGVVAEAKRARIDEDFDDVEDAPAAAIPTTGTASTAAGSSATATISTAVANTSASFASPLPSALAGSKSSSRTPLSKRVSFVEQDSEGRPISRAENRGGAGSYAALFMQDDGEEDEAEGAEAASTDSLWGEEDVSVRIGGAGAGKANAGSGAAHAVEAIMPTSSESGDLNGRQGGGLAATPNFGRRDTPKPSNAQRANAAGVCYHFAQTGRCARGSACRFEHVQSGVVSDPQRYTRYDFSHDEPESYEVQQRSNRGAVAEALALAAAAKRSAEASEEPAHVLGEKIKFQPRSRVGGSGKGTISKSGSHGASADGSGSGGSGGGSGGGDDRSCEHEESVGGGGEKARAKVDMKTFKSWIGELEDDGEEDGED